MIAAVLPTLELSDIRLRPWRSDDASSLHRAMQDPDTVRWMAIELPYTLDDAERFIAGTDEAWARRNAAHLAIVDREDDLVGYIGVLSVEDGMRVVEIGYWVAPDSRGHGVASQALQSVVEWIRDELGPDRIELGMLAGNDASRRVAEKAGFQLDRTEESGKLLDGDPVDEWIFLLP